MTHVATTSCDDTDLLNEKWFFPMPLFNFLEKPKRYDSGEK